MIEIISIFRDSEVPIVLKFKKEETFDHISFC